MPDRSKPPPPALSRKACAASPSTRVSRVEGHGKVTILLDDAEPGAAGAAAHRRVPRLREVHRGPALLGGAGDGAAAVRHLPGVAPPGGVQGARPRGRRACRSRRRAEKIRRLMHYGQVMQSHALHFFHLASPDLLFGFDSDVNRRNIVGVAAGAPRHREEGRAAAQVRPGGDPRHRRQAGARHRLGARRHEQACQRRRPRRCCSATWQQMIAWAQDAVDIAKTTARAEPGAVRPLRQLPLQHAVAGARRRRARPVRRRDPRARRRRRDSSSTAPATRATST